MKRTRHFLLVFSSALLLTGCELDVCRSVDCGTGGTCDEGYCACFEGYSGAQCDVENEFGFGLSETRIIAYPGAELEYQVSISGVDENAAPLMDLSAENVPDDLGVSFGESETNESTFVKVTVDEDAEDADYEMTLVATTKSGTRKTINVEVQILKSAFDLEYTDSLYTGRFYTEYVDLRVRYLGGQIQDVFFSMEGAPDEMIIEFNPTKLSNGQTGVVSIRSGGTTGTFEFSIVGQTANGTVIKFPIEMTVVDAGFCLSELTGNYDAEQGCNLNAWEYYSSEVSESTDHPGHLDIELDYGSTNTIYASVNCINNAITIPTQQVGTREYSGDGLWFPSDNRIQLDYTIKFSSGSEDNCSVQMTRW